NRVITSIGNPHLAVANGDANGLVADPRLRFRDSCVAGIQRYDLVIELESNPEIPRACGNTHWAPSNVTPGDDLAIRRVYPGHFARVEFCHPNALKGGDDGPRFGLQTQARCGRLRWRRRVKEKCEDSETYSSGDPHQADQQAA